MEKRNDPGKLKAVILDDEEWATLLEVLGYAVEVWYMDPLTAAIPPIQDKIKAILSSQT